MGRKAYRFKIATKKAHVWFVESYSSWTTRLRKIKYFRIDQNQPAHIVVRPVSYYYYSKELVEPEVEAEA
jgi:hypothetical protein